MTGDGCTCDCCTRRALAAAIPEAVLGAEHAAFKDTGSGLHAWIAYRRARQAGCMPPEWVMDYFDECYARLKVTGGTSSTKAIAAALQLETRGGGRAAGKRAITRRQHDAVVQSVMARQFRAGA